VHHESWLTLRFESSRPRLRGVAYRLLGSLSEAEDAVQEAWLRLNRSDMTTVQNLDGWLTTVVSRVCLDMLRSRKTRREQPVGAQVAEARVVHGDGADPETEAVLAESVGAALLVVRERLTPAERIAFVLHDLFAWSFDEISTSLSTRGSATSNCCVWGWSLSTLTPRPATRLSSSRAACPSYGWTVAIGVIFGCFDANAINASFRARMCATSPCSA